jgi:hypothetical protein
MSFGSALLSRLVEPPPGFVPLVTAVCCMKASKPPEELPLLRVDCLDTPPIGGSYSSGFSSFLAGYGEGEDFLPFYRGLALFIFNIVYNSCL